MLIALALIKLQTSNIKSNVNILNINKKVNVNNLNTNKNGYDNFMQATIYCITIFINYKRSSIIIIKFSIIKEAPLLLLSYNEMMNLPFKSHCYCWHITRWWIFLSRFFIIWLELFLLKSSSKHSMYQYLSIVPTYDVHLTCIMTHIYFI